MSITAKQLIVDSVRYDKIHVVSLKRNFDVLDGENSGRVKTGKMVRDIIGTYYNYTLEIEADDSADSIAQYDSLYEVLSNTSDAHYIRVPYGQTTLTYYAYVTSGQDELAHADGDVSKWQGLSVNFIAMNPQRTPT